MKLIDFTKEGKGIDKDAPPKKPIVRYFEILWQKRFKLMGVNLMYILFSLPVFALVIFLLYFFTSFTMSMAGFEDLSVWIQGNNGANADTFFRMLIFTFIFFTTIPLFSMGPAYAGTTYLVKSFVKEEPVFLWTDFTTKMRSNTKMGLKVGLINGIIMVLLMLDSVVYLAIINNSKGIFSNVPSFVSLLIALFILFGSALFFMMNIYIYQMVVTFKITLRQLYKNAFIFAMIRWLPNLLILILDVLLIGIPLFLIPGAASFFVTGILYIFIWPSVIMYTNNFYAYPVIKKYLIDNPEADKSDGPKESKEFPDVVPTEGMQRFVNGRYIGDEEWEQMQKENKENSDNEKDN